ncbi:MAG: hypothetical protein H6558_12300 [Lewinellaceae bacterium]|nr:hypothetical protein [Lewinellaceae bacterium]MCB9290968.1 hypothetical protein [Lewinellaceae bacterium]
MGWKKVWKTRANNLSGGQKVVSLFCFCALLALAPRQLKCQDISATRFFKIDYQTLGSPSQLVPRQGGFVPSRAYEPNHLIKAELKFPVKLKGRTRVFGELKYNNEYVFGIYSPIEDDGVSPIKLHESSLSFIVSHKFGNGYSLLGKFGMENSSDHFWKAGGNSLSWSNSILLQKENANGKYGLGASCGLAVLGRLSILPLILYQRKLPRNWELDLLLPAKMLAIKNVSNSSRFIMGVKGSSGNYYLSGLAMDGLSGLNYRRLSANAILGYEKLVTPLVGVGIEAGATIPVQSGVYRQDKRWQEVHNFGQKVDPYFNFKIFFAVPR